MKLLNLSFLCAVLFSASSLISAQSESALDPPKTFPVLEKGKGLVQLQVPLSPEYATQGVELTLQKPEKTKVPLSVVRRLFSETVQAVSSTISPEHQLNLHLHVLLRLAQKRDFVYIHQPQGTMISMKRWDEVMFARLLARAIPSSILSEKDADKAARQAITRTRATISADDLKAE
jgi:hypothetical protein